MFTSFLRIPVYSLMPSAWTLSRLLERPEHTQVQGITWGIIWCSVRPQRLTCRSVIFFFFIILPTLLHSLYSPPLTLSELLERPEHHQSTINDLGYRGLFCESPRCEFGERGHDRPETGFSLSFFCENGRKKIP